MAASTTISSKDSPTLLLHTAIAAVESFNKVTAEDIIAPFASTATHQLLSSVVGEAGVAKRRLPRVLEADPG